MAIEDNIDLEGCCDDDVISFSNKLYTVETFKIALNTFLECENSLSASYPLSQHLCKNDIPTDQRATLSLCNEGLEARILSVNPNSNGWKKGKLKLKISLEFIPDEPEILEYKSPLDEIREHPSFSTLQ